MLGFGNIRLLPLDYTDSILFFLTLCMLAYIFFKEFFQLYHQCQTVLIKTRPGVLSGVIYVQTVCENYQLTTPADMNHYSTF